MSKELEVSKNNLCTTFEPIVLAETQQTRLIALPHKFPDSGLRLKFIHQKKLKMLGMDYWDECSHFKKKELKPGEYVGIELGTEATKQLLESLPLLAKAAELDFENGTARVAPLGENQAVVSNSNRAEMEAFQSLLENKSAEDIKIILDDIIPEVVQRLSELKIIDSRRRILAQFKEQLHLKIWQEKEWQNFFHQNQWIFGYGTHFCYLEQLRKEGYCGGKDDTNSGGQCVDFIMATVMDNARFTVLVEIKTPETPLINKQHRNRVYTLNDALVSSVSQIQYYCNRWEKEGALLPETLKQYARKSIYTYSPKGILIIGHSDQFGNDEDKFATFELYRRGLHNIDILTYDELLCRAEFIVGHTYQEAFN